MKELVALRRKAMDYLQRDGQVAADAYFCAEQNAARRARTRKNITATCFGAKFPPGTCATPT